MSPKATKVVFGLALVLSALFCADGLQAQSTNPESVPASESKLPDTQGKAANGQDNGQDHSQVQSSPQNPTQAPSDLPNAPSSSQPSLSDLGFTPAESQANSREQALLVSSSGVGGVTPKISVIHCAM